MTPADSETTAAAVSIADPLGATDGFHGQPPPPLLVRARRWLILAMLLSLHLSLIAPDYSEFKRVWLLIHFGLFLIWQPFVSTERELNVIATAVLVGITGVVLSTLAGWMLVTWIAILIAIMGGKVFTLQAAKRGRFYLVAVFYLFAMLLTWSVPVGLLGLTALPIGFDTLAKTIFPLALITMVFLPFRPEDEISTQVFDFFYSLFVFQLAVVLVLGSVASMRVTNNQYFPAVLLTVLAFAGALLILAILWGPRSGFGGLRTYFSRYLMSVGMPFELWMRRVAELSEAETHSSRFLDNAMEEVAKMPWLSGAKWTSPDGSGQFGRETIYDAEFRYHELEIRFFTEISLSPALFLHLRLLAQVIGEFYEGKRREQTMKENAYMQAVYETGARLTHDIKNLLQSLFTITSASMAQRDRQAVEMPNDRRQATKFDSMLNRQLPELTKRLQTTLDKLQNPAVAVVSVSMPAEHWWNAVLQRHASAGISFVARGPMETMIPSNIFEAVLENCLENARKKKAREPAIAISVELSLLPSPQLSISDTGSPVPMGALEGLFRAPISNTRGGGLGIGLYQAARQAAQAGYEFSLLANEPGQVKFSLRALRTDEAERQPSLFTPGVAA